VSKVKVLLAALLGVAALLVFSPVASALVPASPSGRITCEQATKTVSDLEAKITVETGKLAGLEKAVADAIAADNLVKPPLTVDSPVTVAAKKALADAKTLIASIKVDLGKAQATKDRVCTIVTPSPTVTVTSTPPPVGQVSCANLSYKEAQAVLKNNPGDPFNLDPDKDGEACDFKRPVSQPVTPSGSVATGG